MIKNNGCLDSFVMLYILFWIYEIICWIINIIQFFSLDFDPIGKTEVIKAIGVFIPPLAGITVYF